MVTTATTLRAAVQAEIDALPYEVRLGTEADAPKVIALGDATSYCDWSKVKGGQVSFGKVLQALPVVTRDKKRVIAFQVYRPIDPPRCEVVNVVIDESLPLVDAARAVLQGAVPVYRALIKLGFTTTFGSEKTSALAMVRGLGLPIKETIEGIDTVTGEKHYGFELDMVAALAVMEKVLGL